MQDLISRREAIRAITNHNGVVDKSVAKRILTQLPSAQPELIEQGAYVRGFEQGRT